MTTDEQVIEAFEATKAHPVEEARRRLAPVREFALATRRELQKLQAADAPALRAAEQFFAWARANGFSGSDLGGALREANGNGELPGFLQGSLTSCELVIRSIDELTPEAVYQDMDKYLATRTASLRPLVGAHKKLVEKIRREHEILKGMVERASQTPAKEAQ